MSGFNNRRSGPNVAQFLRELQTPTQPPSPEDGILEDELAMFTNAQFNDWESRTTDFSAPLKVDTDAHPTTTADLDAASPAVAGSIGLDFSLPDEFNTFDFGTFATPVQAFPDNLGNLQPLQPNPSASYPAPGSQHNHYPVPPSQSSDDKLGSESAGPHRQLNFEDQSRHAAEEDKRKRNTAASARFRIKKKAREQALEKREKELSEEVSQMKNRITHLETENKWLRGLVMEKSGAAKDSKFETKLSAFLKTMGRDVDSDEGDIKRAAKAE